MLRRGRRALGMALARGGSIVSRVRALGGLLLGRGGGVLRVFLALGRCVLGFGLSDARGLFQGVGCCFYTEMVSAMRWQSWKGTKDRAWTYLPCRCP